MDDLDIDESLPGQELEAEDVQEEIRRENDSAEKYGLHKDSDPEYNHPLTEKNFLPASLAAISAFVNLLPSLATVSPKIFLILSSRLSGIVSKYLLICLPSF